MSKLFAELKRRNVIRMAALYLVVAWLIVQVAETVLPIFAVPNWVLQAVVILVALGLLPALAFAWVYELTPDGLKRDFEVEPNASIAPQTARRMDRLIVAGVAIAVAVLMVDRFRERDPAPASPPASPSAPATTTDASSPGVPAPAPATVPTAVASSIAVLPFADLSEAKDQEYFADGLSEELLNRLARGGALQVAARTSSFRFKGKNRDIGEIARALKVRNVLEGSVRKSGARLRVTAQLIDAESGFHRWSETYDRQLTDLFAVQDEIAQAIGDALEVRLAPARDGASGRGAAGLQAYDAYLLGLYHWNKRTGPSVQKAISLFEQAIALDPGLAKAHATLATAWLVLPAYSTSTTAEGIVRAESAIERALALDPGLVEGLCARALALEFRSDWPGAGSAYQSCLAANPSYATAHHWYGLMLARLQDRDAALRHLRRALELDPQGLVIRFAYAHALAQFGDIEAALEQLEALLSLDPASRYANLKSAHYLVLLGRYEEARERYHTSARLIGVEPGPLDLVIAGLKDRAARPAALAALVPLERELGWSRDRNTYLHRDEFMRWYLWLGDRERALALAEDVFWRSGSNSALGDDATLRDLWGDPRFNAILARRKLPPTRPCQSVVAERAAQTTP